MAHIEKRSGKKGPAISRGPRFQRSGAATRDGSVALAASGGLGRCRVSLGAAEAASPCIGTGRHRAPAVQQFRDVITM
jgi:hypothetical protein